MTKNLDKVGLRAIAENYDLFYIDLWGVVHNGNIDRKIIFNKGVKNGKNSKI